MRPKDYPLASFVEGKTWKGLPSVSVQINDDDPASALATASLTFRRQPSGEIGARLTPGNGLTIENATTWEISIPKQKLPLSAGVWSWSLDYTTAAGEEVVYMQGTIDVYEKV